MGSWWWVVLLAAGTGPDRSSDIGSPLAPRAVLDLSWTRGELPPEVRDGVTRAVESGVRERTRILARAGIQLELSSPRAAKRLARQIRSVDLAVLSKASTLRAFEIALGRAFDRLSATLPSVLAEDLRETYAAIEFPRDRAGRVAPRARELVLAFFRGVARGLDEAS